MPVSYSPWLVALSITLAIQGSYVGLSLAVQVAQAGGSRRRILLAASATSLALAVWTMHFVGMLAERSPFPVDYLVLPTLISFLVCVIVVGFALLAASAGPATLARLGSAAAVMGLGIVAMHYIGMQSLAACAEMVNSPDLVLAAVAVAIAASGLALWLAFGRSSHRLPFSATALGLAISGMHYTAVSGLSLYPTGAVPAARSVMSPDFLAVVVAFVAFLVSGCFLLLLVPDRSGKSATDRSTAPPVHASPAELQPDIDAELSTSAARTGGRRLRHVCATGRRRRNAEEDGKSHSHRTERIDQLRSRRIDRSGPSRRALYASVRRRAVAFLRLVDRRDRAKARPAAFHARTPKLYREYRACRSRPVQRRCRRARTRCAGSVQRSR